MSVVLATEYPDRIEMAADGGTWDQRGILIGLTDKLRASTTLPLVVTGVGDRDELESLAQYVLTEAEGRTVDQTIDALTIGLQDRPEISSPIRWELVIGGWSETRGPCVWRMRSLLLTDQQLPALRRNISDYVALGPELTGDELLACGWRADDFSAGLVSQFEAMRAKSGASLPDLAPGMKMPPGHYVAGHIDHVVIKVTGIKTVRLHCWPDKIGRPVAPQM